MNRKQICAPKTTHSTSCLFTPQTGTGSEFCLFENSCRALISEWLPAMCDIRIHSTWASLCRWIFELKCSAKSVSRYLTTKKTEIYLAAWCGCFCCVLCGVFFFSLPNIVVRTQSNLSSTKNSFWGGRLEIVLFPILAKREG